MKTRRGVELRRLLAAGVAALMFSCLWGRVMAPGPLRPGAVACRPAVLVDGQLVCGDAALAGLRTLCGGREPGDGDAVRLAEGCAPGRIPGGELLALGAKLDVNSASADELEALPGIGPTLARRIIAARPYHRVADLERVSGIGVARMEGLRHHVRVEIPGPGRAVP